MSDYKKYFRRVIQKYYPANARVLLSEVERHYQIISRDTRFASSSGNPLDKRLDFTAYFLALIMALDRRGENFEHIRRLCLEVTTDYVRPKNAFQAWLKKLPVKLIHTWAARFLVKILGGKVSGKGHPDGFRAEIITDKAETYGLGYGVDILECGICKLFQKHGYQKYASVLCEVDEITTDLAGLELIRTGTIARGAKKCDFRYRKK
jgi:hypothetical protein